ncbi:MAG: hypothetical protein JOZ47_15145 [Kutzneria sp.]|nr:hypothetical protein [Kutzneria sp.]MBV9846389.1 hypothetical protein [Kutzneria sp.]
MSAETERRQLIHDFVDDIVAGTDCGPDVPAGLYASMPDPRVEQPEAWSEVVTMLRDGGFRDSMRRSVAAQAAFGSAVGGAASTKTETQLVVLLQYLEKKINAGKISPSSLEGQTLADQVVKDYAKSLGRDDTPEFRKDLLKLLESKDEQQFRFWQLTAAINGWPGVGDEDRSTEWFVQALTV